LLSVSADQLVTDTKLDAHGIVSVVQVFLSDRT